MRITKRQLRRIIREAIDARTWQGEHIVGDLVRSIDYVGDGRGGDYEKVVGDQVGTVIEIDKDPDGTQYTVLFPDGTTIMDTASEFETVKEAVDYTPMKSFKIPYRNYGYQGRRIISRDRAWLEFVPKGSPPKTQEDMFRAVTLLDSDDPEIGLAMATVHAPKSAGPVENYDVYSVYATTTG